MIPLHLKISGIYSYREKQEIDFRTLTAAHLFGIFGAVGSGKSAILEAIMYALYGETDRLNNRELRSYNMMNLKSNESFIQFDFLAPDKGKFRATVKGKRNSRNKEDVKFERSLYRIAGTDLIPVETSEIQAILGISYENFRRTIIIPQGKFQEFLQLSATQRTDMVKELFNLEKFDLSFQAAKLQKKNDEVINKCKGRLEQIGEVAEGEIIVKQEETTRFTQDLDQTRLLLKQKENLEEEMKRISILHSDLINNREVYSRLETQKPGIQKAEQRLNDFDECVSNFKSDFDLLDNKRLQLKSEGLQLEKKLAEFSLEQEKFVKAENHFNHVRKEYDNRDLLIKNATELEHCAKINTLNKTVGELNERIDTGEVLIKEARGNWESLKAKAKEISALQETIKGQLPDFGRLQQARDWFSNAKLLKERLDTQLQKKTSLVKEIDNFGAELARISRQFKLPGHETNTPDSTIRLLLGEKRQETENAILQIRHQLLQLEVQDKLKSFASDLQEGKPCPLCGSTEHPHVIQVEDVEKELELLKNQRTTHEKQLQLIDNSLNSSGIFLESISRKQPELESISGELAKAESIFQDHAKNFIWSGLTEEKLNEELKLYSSLQEQIENLNQQAKEAASLAEAELEKVNKFSKLLENRRRESGENQKIAETLISQITQVDYSAHSNTTSEALLAEAEDQRRKYHAIGVEYAEAEKMQSAHSAIVQSLNGTIGNIKLSIQTLTSSRSEIQKQLEARILSSRFGNESHVREILALKIDRQQERMLIRQFHEKYATIGSAIQLLEKQLEGKSYDPEVHGKLKQEINDFKNKQEEQNQAKIASEIELERLKKALEDSRLLKSELQVLEIRRDNLKTLSDLFRAQGFVNFVSTIHLQNLIRGANERFYRLTRQQLKLELDSENNFRVRDYLNEGQWRNVKTLSGGQTFQASLCLALALADNIQQLNQSGQNFFFLDEGFGTLDRESLELVFETLKTLRRENRVVGVISHVEDLQQEIGAWLRVTRDEEHGSRVEASWE